MILRIVLGAAMLCLSLPGALRAQSDTLIDAYLWHQQFFFELDASRQPAPILLERTGSYENAAHFTGQTPAGDSTRLSISRLGKLHFALLASLVDSAAYTGIDEPVYVPYSATRAHTDTVRLAGLFLSVSRFADSVFTDSLLLIDTVAGRLRDNPAKLSGPSPYQLDTVFAFAAVADAARGQTVTYILDSALWVSNAPLPHGLSFDAGDGSGPQPITWGDTLTISYAFDGSAPLSLQFSVPNRAFSAFAKTQIPPPQRPATGLGDSCIYQLPGIKIVVEFADPDCDTLFKNTVIVIDGIDPGRQQFGYFSKGRGKYRNYQFPASHPEAGKNFYQILQERNYDFVFLDPDDGGQSIESTAQLVKEAIRFINDKKARDGANHYSIVIGHSMGGLVGKQALAEMERDDEDHQVAKFITFDSPLRGAHIPYSFQIMLQHLLAAELGPGGTKLIEYAKDIALIDTTLNSDAARQLLIRSWNVDAVHKLRESPSFLNVSPDQTAYLAFQAQFQALDLRIPEIAISNASSSLDHQSGVQGRAPQIVPSAALANMLISKSESKFFTRKSAEMDLTARLHPGAYTADIHLQGWFRRVLLLQFGLVANAWISVGHNDDEFQVDLWQYPPYDHTPASYSDNGLAQLTTIEDDAATATVFVNHYAFVPLASAFGFDTIATGGCGPGITECYATQAEFRPSRFYGNQAETANHEHVTVSDGVADFLLRHITESATFGQSGSEPIIAIQYNYGSSTSPAASTPDQIYGQKTVVAGGALYVNRAGRIADVNDPSNPSNDESSFDLTLTSGPCDGPLADITLESGAAFRVGEDVTRTATVTALPGTRVTVESGAVFAVNNDSRATFLTEGPDGAGGLVVRGGGVIDARFGGQIVADGGVIRIESGGHLRTTSYGAIVARNGGRIILEDGANVELWDGTTANSDGRLSIQDGGKLVIEGEYTFTGSGYFHLARGAEVHGPGALRIRRGDVATATPNKELRRLVLTGGAQIALDPGQNLSVEQCLVEAGGGGIAVSGGGTVKIADVAWEIGSPAVASDALGDVEIRDADFVGGYGPYIEVASATVVRSVLVDDVSFYDMDNGITFAGDPALASARTRPKISNAHFYGGRRGLQVAQLRGVGADDCTFAGLSESAVNVIDGTIGLRDCTIDGQHTTQHGLVVENESLVEWRGGGISDCETGAYGVGGADVWFFECASVVDNGIGLDGHDVTYRLGGIVLVGNDAPVRGVDVFLTRSPHGNPAGSLVQNTLGRVGRADFLLIDYSSPPPTIDLRFTEWIQDGAPAIPDRYWFCSQYQNNYCSRDNVVFAPVVEGHGCGNDSPVDPPCSDPPCKAPCPEDGPCFGSGGGGVVALAVRPNPAGTGTQLRVSLPGAPGRLAVVDVLGREHYGLRIAAGTPEVTLPPGALTPGAYFVTFAPDDGRAPETVTATIVRS